MIDLAQFTDEQLLFTTTQAGKLLSISRTTVYQLINQGELHPVHVATSCRISRAELKRYVARLDAANGTIDQDVQPDAVA